VLRRLHPHVSLIYVTYKTVMTLLKTYLYLFSFDILRTLLRSFSTDFFRLFFGFSTDLFSIQHHPLCMLRFSIRSTRSAHYIRAIYRHSAQSSSSDSSVRYTARPVNWRVTAGTSNRRRDIYYLVSFIYGDGRVSQSQGF
jgi:hypothetical protein